MLYILKGYVKKETGCNIMQAYKTKAAAKKRFNKMIESGCYEFVEIIEKNNKQALWSHCAGSESRQCFLFPSPQGEGEKGIL